MNIYAWILVVWFALGGLWIISQVGKPRPPFDNRDAVIAVLITGLQIWLVSMAVSS